MLFEIELCKENLKNRIFNCLDLCLDDRVLIILNYYRIEGIAMTKRLNDLIHAKPRVVHQEHRLFRAWFNRCGIISLLNPKKFACVDRDFVIRVAWMAKERGNERRVAYVHIFIGAHLCTCTNTYACLKRLLAWSMEAKAG